MKTRTPSARDCFWTDLTTGRTWRARNSEAREANRLHAKHRDLAQRKGPRRNEGLNGANRIPSSAVVMR